MHFGFALGSSDVDLWNIDLFHTHLGLLDTDISSKHFFLSPRRLEDVFETCLQHVFKTSWRPTNVGLSLKVGS